MIMGYLTVFTIIISRFYFRKLLFQDILCKKVSQILGKLKISSRKDLFLNCQSLIKKALFLSPTISFNFETRFPVIGLT